MAPVLRGPARPGYLVPAVDERERRLAKNEALFRELNERIEQVAIGQAEDAHVFEFLCECSNIDCTLRLKPFMYCAEGPPCT